MSGENRCSGCGEERPANTPEGLCPRCLMRQEMTGDTPGPADVDATTTLAATSSGYPLEPSPGDFEATGAYNPGPAAGAASASLDTVAPHGPPATAEGNAARRNLHRAAIIRYFGDYEIRERAGPRRHGRGLQGPAGQPQPARRPQDDQGRAFWPTTPS